MAIFIVVDNEDRAWTVENVDGPQKAVDKLVREKENVFPVLVAKVADEEIMWNSAHTVEHKFTVINTRTAMAF